LFKLKSAIFLIDFPVSFTICMMNLWLKLMPMPTSDYCNSKEEAEQITLTRNVIKEFGTAV